MGLNMKQSSLIIIVAIISQLSLNAQNVVVGYVNGYYSSYPYNVIDYTCLTHINHAFVIPNADGTLNIDSWFLYPQMISEAHKNNVKVLVAVGGYGQSDGFSPMTADPTARAMFIKNIVNFCEAKDYDGVDIDWEYPTATDRSNLTLLVSELRSALDTANIPLLTAAIPVQDWNNSYDLNNLKNYLDWFGVMTYDFYGSWETKSGHQSALYNFGQQALSVDKAVKYYLNKGVPANKLCIGIPFGGYLLNTTGLFQPNNGGSTISYVDANKKISQGWEYNWDADMKVPYLQNAAHTQLITYDDTISLKLKCDYILKNNLKGTIIWKIGRDYSGGKAPLLETLGKYLLNVPFNAPQPPVIILPENESQVDSQSINLEWNPTDSTTSYNLQLSTKEDFSVIAVNKTNINLTSYKLQGLSSGNTYYWRVSSSNISGNSEWSSVSSFTIKTIASVKNEAIVPSQYSLVNYPNPFNPSTKFELKTSKRSNISLKIFDVLGNEITTIVNKNLFPGTYIYNWNANNLTSGIYFCVLRTDQNNIVRKIELLK